MERDDEWLTTRELATELKVKPRTIESWRYHGKGPKPHRLGHRTVRYRRRDVEKWLATQAA